MILCYDSVFDFKTDLSIMNNAQLTYADIQAIVSEDFAIMDKQVFGSLNSKVQLVMSVSNMS